MNAHIRTTARPKPKRTLPKEQRGKRAAFLVQSFAAAVCIAVVLLPGIWLATTVVGKRQLAQTGIQTTATITKHHSKIRYGATGNSGVDFLIDYTFTPDHQSEECSTDVDLPLDLWETVQVGSKISVTYNAPNPSNNQPTMTLGRYLPALTNIVGIFVGVLSAGIFVWVCRVVTSRRRKSQDSEPRTDIDEGGTAKHDRSKEHRVQRDAPKAHLVEGLIWVLAIFSVSVGIFVVSIVFLGPLVVELLENVLLWGVLILRQAPLLGGKKLAPRQHGECSDWSVGRMQE
ncbi:DUF3592 domain-containing protein [Arthrobacter sp. UYCu511]|uniref:DUF3592 domain-containing protein n=1 Tax=Arthrobacter sp. UYCu511 TaxID=3156337 RepID=UPI0033937D3D